MTYDARQFWFIAAMTLLGAWLAACGPGTSNAGNKAPEITLDVGSEAEYQVGDVVQIRVTATDPDGDSLSFDVANRPPRAEFTSFQQEALFDWNPNNDATMESPWRLTFIVEDEHGKRAEKVVVVTINPGNGVPEFRLSGSKLYDVNSNDPLSFEVEVRDDDSTQVMLSMPPTSAPEGASFQVTGDKTGEFQWDPSPDQEEKRVHSVVFVADDGDNEAVRKKVNIVFKNRDDDPDPNKNPGECNETLPIEFSPLPAQHTLDDYAIEAQFASQSMAEKYDIASVLWTTKDALNDLSIDYNAAQLRIDGKKMTGDIPNLQLNAGESKEVYYSVCALDNEADQNADDKLVCSPDLSFMFHSFIAYSPDDDECIDDQKAIGSKSVATKVSADKWNRFRACKGKADYHEFEVGSEETVDVLMMYSKGQNIDFEVIDESGNTVKKAVAKSNCRGLANIHIEHTGSDTKATYYVKVTGSDLPYQTKAFRMGGSSGMCTEDAEEPNDSVDKATLVVEDKTYKDMSICKKDDQDVFVFEMMKGDKFGSSVKFTHANGNLDAKLFAPSQEMKVAKSASGVAEGVSMDDDESITHTAMETGLYHLLVYSNDTANDYEVRLDTTCRDTDQFNNNHNRMSAGVVSLQKYPDLKACSGQSDWYERTGFSGTSLSATLDIKEGATVDDITFAVYDDMGRKVQDSIKVGEKRLIDFTPSSNQQYLFEVKSTKNILYSIKFEQN